MEHQTHSDRRTPPHVPVAPAPYDPPLHARLALPDRRSVRLRHFDYSAPGTYFLTLCTENRECLFGEVIGGEMRLNDLGREVEAEWLRTRQLRRESELDAFVIMPNHLHGIVGISRAVREGEPENASAFGERAKRSISSMVAGFKAAATARINRMRGTPRAPVWQRNFYEHVVRDNDGLAAIRAYIARNPERWSRDAENPAGDGTDDVNAFVAELVRAAAEGAGSEGSEEGQGRVRLSGTPLAAGPASSAGAAGIRPYAPTANAEPRGTAGRAHGRVPLPFRVGHGYDLHRLRPGGRLVLAGVEVSTDLSPVAHSDGDVVLHALVDALRGALGLGDIGEHFPNTDPRWKDAPSRVFVEHVFELVRRAGYSVGNVDVTILAERPKLKAFKPAMRQALADLLHIDLDQVNVKAGTNEGVDAIGRGEAVAAHAVVLLARAD